MPRGQGFLRDDDSPLAQVDSAARPGAALPSPDASQGLPPQGFSQRRSPRGLKTPLPLQTERPSVETPPTLNWSSATPTLSRSSLPQVAAYCEMQGSASRDTSLHPKHQGIAPYRTLEAAASRTGTGFTRTPGDDTNHIIMGDETARPSVLQAYESIEKGSRESNVLQATETPSHKNTHRSSDASATSRRGGRFAVEEGAGVGGREGAGARGRECGLGGGWEGGSSPRQGLASSELFPGSQRPVRTGTDLSIRGTDLSIKGTDSAMHRSHSMLRRADSFARDSSSHSTQGTRRRRLNQLLRDVSVAGPLSEHSYLLRDMHASSSSYLLRDNFEGEAQDDTRGKCMTPSWSRKVADARTLADDTTNHSRSVHSRLSQYHGTLPPPLQRPTTIAQFVLEHGKRHELGHDLGRLGVFTGELSSDVKDLIDLIMAGSSSHGPGDKMTHKIARRTEAKGVVAKFLKYFTGTMAPLNSWLAQGIARHELAINDSKETKLSWWCSAVGWRLVCMYCMDVINVLLRGAAQVVLLNSPLTGAVIVVALYIQVPMCVCVRARVRACVRACVRVRVCVHISSLCPYPLIHVCVFTHICMYVSYVCMYVYIRMYLHTHTNTHTHTHSLCPSRLMACWVWCLQLPRPGSWTWTPRSCIRGSLAITAF
jgi:hypothetical protein